MILLPSPKRAPQRAYNQLNVSKKKNHLGTIFQLYRDDFPTQKEGIKGRFSNSNKKKVFKAFESPFF